MAQEPYSKLEEVTSSSKKRCRCSTTYVQIACQISCIVLLIICVVSIERRLSFLENRLDTMAEEFKKDQSTDHRSERSDGHKEVIREKRAVRDSKQANTLKRRCENKSFLLPQSGILRIFGLGLRLGSTNPDCTLDQKISQNFPVPFFQTLPQKFIPTFSHIAYIGEYSSGKSLNRGVNPPPSPRAMTFGENELISR